MKGKSFSIGSSGGPDQAVVDRCLQRMRALYHLVRETVSAEFPSHELISAFSCFDVSNVRVRAAAPLDCLRRIATAYTINEPRLCTQFQDIEPNARHVAQTTGRLDK